MSENIFIDFHCHPSLKPYGKSFKTNPGENSTNRRNKNSIWFYDSPNLFERALQLLTGIAKFTQADCTTLGYGNVRIICASLYPIEKGFFNNDLGVGEISDLANQFITSVSKERVDYVQNITDYFEDLVREYEFYRQLNNQPVKTDGGKYQYLLVKNYREIEDYTQANPEDKNVIFIVMSIEGMHALMNDISKEPVEKKVLDNVRNIKTWEHPPFFVTFCHHFNNFLGGHAKSLTGIVGNKTDQSVGLNEEIKPLGKKVIRELLSTSNGRRVLIDIKHMSARARKDYFAILAEEFPNENIPVIVSHGAANGLRSMDEKIVDGKDTAYKLLQEDINFYDNEILAVVKSNGLFCLQLDERRVAGEQTLKSTRHSIFMQKIRHYRSELLWNQVQHIAELLDRNDLFAWNNIAIGSDFDGIINPLNGFLTQETIVHLQEYLERHAFNYMNEGNGKNLKPYNQIKADEIVHRIFNANGLEFLRKWF